MSTETSTAAPPAPELPPLRSVHTANFGPLLGELGRSLLVTTYQAGKLVVLRRNDEGTLNTHFSALESIGTELAEWRLSSV